MGACGVWPPCNDDVQGGQPVCRMAGREGGRSVYDDVITHTDIDEQTAITADCVGDDSLFIQSQAYACKSHSLLRGHMQASPS